MSASGKFKVVIVGGGSAALEAAFRLQRVAGDAVETTILAPDDHFTTHAMAVLVPFTAGHVPKEPLARMASDAGATLLRGRMASVDTAAHQAVTEDGEGLSYDALLIAVGAVQRLPYRYGIAFGAPGTEEAVHGLVQDLEAGAVRRLGFVVPPEATWPVPLYELALMAVDRAYEQYQLCETILVTHEPAPLALFGPEASRVMAQRLEEAGIEVRTGVRADVRRNGVIGLGPVGERVTVGRVVTLPVVDGPALEGLPHDARGFLPVDEHGRVDGVADVYAAGDVTNHPIKQGGLACQQADAAAEAIAAHAGVAITPEPYAAELQGVVMTGHGAVIMSPEGGVAQVARMRSEGGLWWPPLKIAGRELVAHVADLRTT